MEESEYVYILETNGMTLGADPGYVQDLARYRNLHVRVSIKGTDPTEFHELTGARASSFDLPFRALEHLIDARVSCNACVMISFSDQDGISSVKNRLAEIRPGLLKSLELERITLFPKVAKRLRREGLIPDKHKESNKLRSYQHRIS